MPVNAKRNWGVRLRMWLAALVLAFGIIKHRPLIAISVALLIAITALTSHFSNRRKDGDA